jgi:methanogenic corrinoid protein MtbC1
MLDAERLTNALADLEDDLVFEILKEVMADGGSEVDAALKACQEGMTMVGDRFEAKEYYVADLVFAGELMTSAMEIVRPALEAKGDGQTATKMILCTVEGDLHDIGKNIVKAILEASGFEVLDLGIDTKVELIVQTAKEQGIKIIALSGVLTLAVDAMKKTVEAFVAEGMRDDVKIIIGGAPVTASICQLVGADAWSTNPQDAVTVCREWAAL